jgi:hypothetical protein
MPLPFQPLSFAEVVDGAATLYRRGFSTLVGTTLLTTALGLGLDLLLAAPLRGTVLPSVVGAVVLAFAWAALTWQVSRLYTGHPVSVNGGLEAAATRLFPLLGAWLIAFVLYGIPVLWVRGLVWGMEARVALSGQTGAIFLLALPWLACLALFTLALALAFAIVPVVVLEGAGPWQAVARSFRLADQALVRVAGVALVIIALGFMVAMGLMWGAGWLGDPAAMASMPAQVLLSIVRALLLPFTVGAAVLMYYDRRVRTEGLDLQTAADELAGIGAADEDADPEIDDDVADEADAESGGDAEPGPAEVREHVPHASG